MKPLAARACARPLTAPSTMTLLECAINCRIRRGHGRVRRRATVPPLLPLDSLVGSLAARPIGSPGPTSMVRPDCPRDSIACEEGCQMGTAV
jgi:hypothetical protein